MSTNLAHDNVISLASIRERRNRGGKPCARHGGPPQTVLAQATIHLAAGDVHRQFGVDDSMSLRDLHEVLDVAFGLDDSPDQPPWYFADDTGRIAPSDPVSDFLCEEGDCLHYLWGLWQIEIRCIGIYPRDNGTPRALCVGGSGGLGSMDFDQTAINAELTGSENIRHILASVRPEIRDIVSRSGIFDFVPLLQALDLTRPTLIDDPSFRTDLPAESTLKGTDAFWSVVLSLSCLSDASLTDEVIEATMDALGWDNGQGEELTAQEVRDLCRTSLNRLEVLRAFGPDAASPVERLEIYRELLRS